MPFDCHSESLTYLGYCLYINLQFITGLFSFGDFVQPLHIGCVLYNPTDTAYALAFPFLPSECAFHHNPWLWPVTESHFATCHLSPSPLTYVLAFGKNPFFSDTHHCPVPDSWTLGCPNWWMFDVLLFDDTWLS